jgi:hypothetical protein
MRIMTARIGRIERGLTLRRYICTPCLWNEPYVSGAWSFRIRIAYRHPKPLRERGQLRGVRKLLAY